jgi:hypothetical protein
MGKWFFQEHDGYGDVNQSSSAEAFEGASVKDLATSLIRESLQNVLDVTLDRSEPARVRFTLVEPSKPESTFDDWFDGLMNHIQSPGAGLPDAPKPEDSCRYLLIEDFNTLGLLAIIWLPTPQVLRTISSTSYIRTD